CQPVGVGLADLDGPPAPLVRQERPDPPAARDREQASLPLTQPSLRPPVLQHLVRVGARQPLRLRHRSPRFPPFDLRPAYPPRAALSTGPQPLAAGTPACDDIPGDPP